MPCFSTNKLIKMASPVSAVPSITRPLANFHPNIWGDHFLSYASHESMARTPLLSSHFIYNIFLMHKFSHSLTLFIFLRKLIMMWRNELRN